MIKKTFLIIFTFLISIGCTNKKANIQQLNYTYQFYDTIKYMEKINGKISLINTFADTIKVDNKESEIINLYLNIFKSIKNVSEIKEKECNIFTNENENFKNKIQTEFFVKPKIKGDAIIAGFIDYIIFIKLKDTTKLRMIEKRYHFKEKVYVK